MSVLPLLPLVSHLVTLDGDFRSRSGMDSMALGSTLIPRNYVVVFTKIGACLKVYL